MIQEFTKEKGHSIPAQETMTSGGGDFSLPHSQKQRLQLSDHCTVDIAGCSKAAEMENFPSEGKGWPTYSIAYREGENFAR